MVSRRFLVVFFLGVTLFGAALLAFPLRKTAYQSPPPTAKFDLSKLETEPLCPEVDPLWRKSQIIDEVEIEESSLCNPDNPALVAAFVKGTNNISHDTLMESGLAMDAVTKGKDSDGDGDPDVIEIRLEVAELNGRSPDYPEPIPGYFIAPGIQPGFWAFVPKTHGMSTENFESLKANPLLRLPSPTIRVEAGDMIRIILENTHYLPHTIHFHGVDHPYMNGMGKGNDGVPETSHRPVMPGESFVYEMKPRQTGTMLYHCHEQAPVHVMLGLMGMFVVEENRPNNWVQTLNVGAGQVRHPSVAVKENYDREYDLIYQEVDQDLNNLIKTANDPRLIAKATTRGYDMTEGTPDYFLLNGQSFPYTLRESLIVVNANERIKLRLANGGDDKYIAIHSHGHRMRITHYDGIEHNPEAQITRDVADLSPAQRLDLVLTTIDDGLHSFGEGVWMFHDHQEKALTSDGMYPGGGITLIVYHSYLGENYMPLLHGVDIKPFFSKAFYERKVPAWSSYDEAGILGDPELVVGFVSIRSLLLTFLAGLLLGGIVIVMGAFKRRASHTRHMAKAEK
ncbi:multicopper oxidase domain-containing protein [Nitrosococcus wardiae]|uniref:Copper oxidase n=1 Tax=Nitrosococcus wardiae TaxID=1814290 RepID=A0A4P7BZB1_9GAMM|nr:multicopper oxidase domain-containing protein [Nitrosococcus wardiae]QBQ53776.1 copper oxidase [Nitrosococcus wardiae]